MTVSITMTDYTSIKFSNIIRNLQISLFLMDIFGLFTGFAISFWLRYDEPLSWLNPLPYGFVCIQILAFYLIDAYEPDRQTAGLRTPARIIICNLAIAFFLSALIYLLNIEKYNLLAWRGVFLPSFGIFTTWAVILRLQAAKWVRTQLIKSHWLILGSGDKAINFAQELLGLNPLGTMSIFTDNIQHNIDSTKFNNLGSLDDLSPWNKESWTEVIIASKIQFSPSQWEVLMQMRLQGIPVYRLTEAYEIFKYKLPSLLLEDNFIVFSDGFNLMNNHFSLKLKRVMDVAISTFLLVLSAPIMLLAALLIKLDSSGPIFYSHLRSGYYGKPFEIFKFRSMVQSAEARGAQWASQGDSRITRVGYWLRLFRIDELPQIWNVLRGEMSLIGPRPERPEFDIKFKESIPYYEVRYLVKPGITGWAQVMYPYGASIEDTYEKLSYDLYYIKNYSIWLDLAIIFKTIRVVLLGKGR